MLQQQGWKIHRVWTPHFFRDPNGCMAGIQRDIEDALADEREQSAKAAELTAAASATGTGSSVRDVIKRRGPKKDQDKTAA